MVHDHRGGIPLALVSGLAVRRGYAGHRLALAAATLTTAALYVVFPLAFIPATQPLTGLGRWVHVHHLLGIAILLIPTLFLLANELRWKQEATPDAEPGPNLRSRIGATPRRYLIGTGVLMLFLVWLAGTTAPACWSGSASSSPALRVPLVQASRDPAWRGSRLEPPEKL